MLRKNFRTKLLGILAVPVVALIAIATFAGWSRLGEARDAGKLRHRIDVIEAGTALAQQVQLEQAASADVVANPFGDRSALVAQRTATDQAAKAYLDTVAKAGDVSSTAFDSALDRVRRNLNALATSYRGAVDLGSDINSVTYAFSEIGASVSDLIGTVADEAHDPGLARDASALAALSHAKDATAKEWAVLEVSLTRGQFKDAEEGTFRGSVTDRLRWLGIHDGLAGSASRSAMQVLLSGPAITVSDSIERGALATTDGNLTSTAKPAQPATSTASQWHDAMASRLGLMQQVLTSDTHNLAGTAATIESAASQDLKTFLLVAAAAVLASTGLGLVLARSVTTPLRQLKDAAEKLADEQLPALVNGLRNPGVEDERYLAATLTPIDVTSNDEIGQLARAFNSVQTVAVDVAAEQATLLRKGISEIFVNLARRNQVLIDRQIEFLDELEATEDDPDQLAQLYRLDHLATRMRRNAESLLVLAGIEPARTRSRPVPLFDVVRAAIGEVEDFSRIELAAFDDVDVVGNGAVDLGHLLAELMDNAAHFSPPDTRVRIEGRHGRAGYVIAVRDSGIGMTEEALAEANELLASPPPVGLALSRSLGFTVVARLAARYGVSVRLLPGDPSGTAAIVHLPQHLIASAEPDEAWAPGAHDAPAAVADHSPQVAVADVTDVADVADEPSFVEAVAQEPAIVESGAASNPDEPGDAADDEFETVMRSAWGDDEPLTVELEGFDGPHAADDATWADDELAWRDASSYDGAADDSFDEPYADESYADDPYASQRDDARAAWVDAFGEGADIAADEAPANLPPLAETAPASLREALPEGASFDQGLAALVDGSPALGSPAFVEGEVPEATVDVGDAVHDNDEPADHEDAYDFADHDGDGDEIVDAEEDADAGDEAGTTAAGLTRRVRRTDRGVEGLDRFRAAPSGPSILATKRSPDDVRAMLARYRTGLHRGRSGDEPIDPETRSK